MKKEDYTYEIMRQFEDYIKQVHLEFIEKLAYTNLPVEL